MKVFMKFFVKNLKKMKNTLQLLSRFNNNNNFSALSKQQACFYATIQSKAVRYEKFGNPLEVLK